MKKEEVQALIAEKIKTNGEGAITAETLADVMNAITNMEEANPAPSNPVIVANLASLPGVVEVSPYFVDADYPGGVIEIDGEYIPKVLKAGHPIIMLGMDNYALGVKDGFFTYDGLGIVGPTPAMLGVITEDAPTSGNYYKATCSVMIVGVVDATKCPGKFAPPDEDESMPRFRFDYFQCGVQFINALDYLFVQE